MLESSLRFELTRPARPWLLDRGILGPEEEPLEHPAPGDEAHKHIVPRRGVPTADLEPETGLPGRFVGERILRLEPVLGRHVLALRGGRAAAEALGHAHEEGEAEQQVVHGRIGLKRVMSRG